MALRQSDSEPMLEIYPGEILDSVIVESADDISTQSLSVASEDPSAVKGGSIRG